MARRARATAQGPAQQGTPASGSPPRGPAARSGGPADRSGGPADRSGGPADRSGGPAGRSGGPAGRPGGPRPARRTARFSTGGLVAMAVVFSLVLLIGLSVQAVAAHASCSTSPLLLNVAVNDDLAPAVAQVAQNFNKQQHMAGGRCVTVQVT